MNQVSAVNQPSSANQLSAETIENEDRVAIVTGGGRGIGRAIVEKLSADGLRVVINDVDEEPVAELIAELEERGGSAVAAVGSIRDTEFPERLLKTALTAFGRVDVVVNNAGFATYGPIEDLPVEEWNVVLDVLASAPFRLLQPIGRYFRDTPAPGPRSVVNIASVAAVYGSARQASYGAGKAASVNLAQSLALEWAKYNVTSNAICPGIILTRLTVPEDGVDSVTVDGQTIPMAGVVPDSKIGKIPVGRAGLPEDVAGVVHLLTRPEASYINGQSIVVDGGWRLTH